MSSGVIKLYKYKLTQKEIIISSFILFRIIEAIEIILCRIIEAIEIVSKVMEHVENSFKCWTYFCSVLVVYIYRSCSTLSVKNSSVKSDENFPK